MSAPAGIMACRLAAVIALALLLAGCDSCGDFVSPLGIVRPVANSRRVRNNAGSCRLQVCELAIAIRYS